MESSSSKPTAKSNARKRMSSVAIRTLSVNESIAEALRGWSTNSIVSIVKTSKRTVENWKQGRTGPQAKHMAAMMTDDELCEALLTAMGRADIATRARMVAVLKRTQSVLGEALE